MNSILFRSIFVSGLLLGIASALVDVVVPGLLSPSLSEAWDQEPNFFDTASHWVIGLAVIWAVAMLAASLGFFMFKRWARATLLWGSVIGLALYAPFGSSASSWLSTALGDTSSLLFGASLAISYFSPLSSRFAGTSEA
jgi:hypothetical protein